MQFPWAIHAEGGTKREQSRSCGKFYLLQVKGVIILADKSTFSIDIHTYFFMNKEYIKMSQKVGTYYQKVSIYLDIRVFG